MRKWRLRKLKYFTEGNTRSNGSVKSNIHLQVSKSNCLKTFLSSL